MSSGIYSGTPSRCTTTRGTNRPKAESWRSWTKPGALVLVLDALVSPFQPSVAMYRVGGLFMLDLNLYILHRGIPWHLEYAMGSFSKGV